jgi:hypothetical protein
LGVQFVAGQHSPQSAVDFRFGIQFRDWIGLYIQPHLSLGGGMQTEVAGYSFVDAAGIAAATFMVEFTVLSRLFVGVGGGIGSEFFGPSGSCLQARVGGYPLMHRSDEHRWRNGLMVGVDVRTIYFAGATAVEVVSSVGYEFF